MDNISQKSVTTVIIAHRLSTIKNIMDLIIEAQDPNNAFLLFKLLTLDLSPCLVKFILNIFMNAFESMNRSNNFSGMQFERPTEVQNPGVVGGLLPRKKTLLEKDNKY